MDNQEGQSETPMYHTLTPYTAPSKSVIPTVIYPERPPDWHPGAQYDQTRQVELSQYHTYMGYTPSVHQGEMLYSSALYRTEVPVHPGLQTYPYVTPGDYRSSLAPPSSTKQGSASSRPKRKRVQSVTQRRAANIRERRRMFHLNEAFDKLRKRLPAFNYEKRLSRIETLRLAITYISFMHDISNGVDPNKVKLKTYQESDHEFYNNEHEDISEDSMDVEM